MTEADQADARAKACVRERAPWTIKSVRVGLRDDAVRAARAQGVTMGEWMERAVPRQAAADRGNQVMPPGQAVAVPEPMRPMPVADAPLRQDNLGKPPELAELAETQRVCGWVRLAIELSGLDPARSRDPLVRTARATVRATLLALRPEPRRAKLERQPLAAPPALEPNAERSPAQTARKALRGPARKPSRGRFAGGSESSHGG